MAIGGVYCTTQKMRQKYAPRRIILTFLFFMVRATSRVPKPVWKVICKVKMYAEKSSGPVDRIYTPQLDFVWERRKTFVVPALITLV